MESKYSESLQRFTLVYEVLACRLVDQTPVELVSSKDIGYRIKTDAHSDDVARVKYHCYTLGLLIVSTATMRKREYSDIFRNCREDLRWFLRRLRTYDDAYTEERILQECIQFLNDNPLLINILCQYVYDPAVTYPALSTMWLLATQESYTRVCIHEAGHAVVAVCCGCYNVQAIFTGERNHIVHNYPEYYSLAQIEYYDILVCLAGIRATTLFCSGDVGACYGATSDLKKFDAHLHSLCCRDISYLLYDFNSIVDNILLRNKEAILSLADTLFKKSFLLPEDIYNAMDLI